MSKIQIKSTQIKSLSLKNEQIATDAAISLSKIDGGVELQNAVSDLQNDAFVTREVPSGAVDGSNVTFTLANTPVSGSEQVYLNGLLQDPGEGNSYTISGGTITFASAPLSGDEIHVSYATGDYMVAPGGSGGSGGAGAIEIFQDEEFAWPNGSQFNRTITHNKGKFPDLVKVFTKFDSDTWVEFHSRLYASPTNYGWDANSALSTPNEQVVRLFSNDWPTPLPTRIRLYWFSAQDVATATAGNVAGVGGGSGSPSAKYVSPEISHVWGGIWSNTVYTIDHNLNTTPENLSVICQYKSSGTGDKWVQLHDVYHIVNAGGVAGWEMQEFTNNNQLKCVVYQPSGTIRFIVKVI